MTAVLLAFVALAILCAGLSWLADRHPCNHPEWVGLGGGTAVCVQCDEVFQLEER